ncbi:TPR repeat-containing protein [Candidatus Magnetomorum sp. HK-1]|nr:TPR repeat-containing protein [Candidatus Magnetomorum sp. HK-1]
MGKKLIFVLFVIIAIFSGKAMASNETIFFDLGVFALEEGDITKAHLYFKKALAFSPEDPKLLHYLGKTDMAEGRYDSAQKHFVSAWRLNPELTGLAFDLANTYFQQKAYDRSVQLFEKAIQQDTDAEQTVMAHFRAGISYFNKKKYEKAIPHFLSAAEQAPSLKDTAFFYSGICFYHQHDWTLSESYLKQVKMHAQQTPMRRRASKWLQAVRMQRKHFKPFDLYCKMGVSYDDNVELNPPEVDTDTDDLFNTVLIYGRYHLVNEQDLKLGIAYGHYQTTHLDTSEANLINSNVMIYGIQQKKSFQLMTELSPSYYWLDSDRFLGRLQLRLRMTWNIDNVILPYINYSYSYDNHFQDENRDANRNGITLGLSFLFQPDLYKFQTIFSSEKISSTHQDHNYEISKAQFNLNVFAHPLCTVKVTARCGLRDHEHFDSIQHIKRKDKQYHARLGFEIPLIYKGFSADINYQWSKNDSNIHTYDYRKNLIAVYLTVRQ